MSDSLLGGFQGSLLGLAIGDALGRCVEFYDCWDGIEEAFGPDGLSDFVADHRPAGTYSDDTQMAIGLVRALIREGHRGEDAIMKEFSRELVQWHRSPENNRAPGHSCRVGCDKLENGHSWRDSGNPNSKGSASAVRAAPIGLFFHSHPESALPIARSSAMPTHRHPTALAAASAVSLLVSWSLNRVEPREMPDRLATAMRLCDGGEEIARQVSLVPRHLGSHPKDALRDGALGDAWVGEEAIACALYCFCRTPSDYHSTVLTAANTLGDSDSIATLAGALSGAYNGIEGIPSTWRDRVENSALLHSLAQELHQEARGRGGLGIAI